jgi:hypothetical protein
MITRPDLKDEPYCNNCGYILTGAVDSSKCPECGRPLVETLTRNSQLGPMGKRYRSKATLFGLPVIDIALGPAHGQRIGRARGIIAIGDIATGWLALGGLSIGIVAIGGGAVGLFAVGGTAIGLITAMGGLAIGGMALGGAAIGVFACGGGAVGVWAQGSGSFGLFTRNAAQIRRPPPRAPTATDPFERVAWFFGAWPPTAASFLIPMLIIAGLTLAVAALIAFIAWQRLLRDPGPAIRN